MTLNIVSVRLYRSYVRERRNKEESYTSASYNRSQEEIQVVVSTSKAKKLTKKEKNENKAERNMLKTALTLCSISILSRVLLILLFNYFLFFNSFSQSLILLILLVSIYTFGPSVGIFVFYFFNKMFREKFQEKVLHRKKTQTSKPS